MTTKPSKKTIREVREDRRAQRKAARLKSGESLKIGKVFGFCGTARSGKDTAGYFLQEILYEEREQISKICGFADLLKKDLDKLCWTQFGFTSFTKRDEQKKIIRPLLVAYGTYVWRAMDKMHWIEKMKPTVDFFTSRGNNVILTDVRYENEIDWIQKELEGQCIYISREGVEAANEEEALQDPILRQKSHGEISWKTFGEKEIKKAKPKVFSALNNLNII